MTVVKTADIPAIVVDRIAGSSPQDALFDADELSDWPGWTLHALLTAGLFQETSRATEVFCDGCEWGCLKPVVARTSPNGRKTHAYVACDEEPDRGRIRVAPERLRRFITTVSLAARFVARSLALKSSPALGPRGSVFVGHVKGRHGRRVLCIEVRQGELLVTAGGHCIALSELAHWDRKTLALDGRALRRLINRQATRSSQDHPLSPGHPKQDRRSNAKRDLQIKQQAARLQRENRNWTVSRIAKHIARTALAGGITAARVRRILYERNS